MSTEQLILATARDRFGFDGLRDGQLAVMSRLLEGKSAVAIFPTGAGKSLCYQLPALLLDGLTLVVSPLIALMKDQIDFLTEHGIAAARLDSTIDTVEFQKVNESLRAGTLKILYVAPERLANERFIQSMKKQAISLIAVDEAHCISEWGHNFRPDYLRLASVAKLLCAERVLALTATATPDVAKQIAKAFSIDESNVVRTGFYRPNLSLMVSPTTAAHRDGLLLQRMQKRPCGPTIVYVTLQKTAERVAALLHDKGFRASAYHAGLDPDQRTQTQDLFMESTDMTVVATIAFGMGIDKRDLRYVYHYNLPKSIENYAQEIGRAGRDGLDAVCEMLACADDRVVLENFTYGDTPEPSAVAGLTRELLDAGANSATGQFDIGLYDLSGRFDMRPLVVETLLTYLQLLGEIESIGAFYTEYKYRELKSLRDTIARFDPSRREFLNRMFSHARASKVWTKIDLHAAAQQMNEPRDRLVAALNYFADQGILEIEVAGARQAYRLASASRGASDALIQSLTKRFEERERRDIERIDAVTAFAATQGCLTRRLVEHFGEPFDRDCGHCGWCRGHRPAPVTEGSHRRLGDADMATLEELIAEGHEALNSTRQLTRFLCGINSPAASRAKLGRHAAFGAWGDVPFDEVRQFIDDSGG